MISVLPRPASAAGPPPAAYRLDIAFPAIGEEPEAAQPAGCPYCGCRGLHRHQRTPKQVKDQRRQSVASMRYLCKGCRRSSRIYPPGVSARRQSEAVRCLSVVLHRLGLSYRNVQKVLGAWDCPLGPATIWQNVQGLEAGDRPAGSRGRLTVAIDQEPGRIAFPVDGPSVHLRLLTDPGGTMRLEIRTREDWRLVWRRVQLPGLRDLGVRLIGVRPLIARSHPDLARRSG